MDVSSVIGGLPERNSPDAYLQRTRRVTRFGAPIAVAWHRLGPYHRARLRAAAEVLPIVAVEVLSGSRSVPAARTCPYHEVSLFDGSAAVRPARRWVAESMEAVLEGLQPRALVVHGWSDRTALALLRWGLVKGVPSVVMSASHNCGLRRSWPRELVKRRLLTHFSAALVGGTPQAEYAASLGVPRDRIALGYNVVDNAHFAHGAALARRRATEERRRLALPESYFLSVSRFPRADEKNLLRLLEAYARYRGAARGQPWSLVLVGDGALRPALELARDRLGLGAHFVMPGYKPYEQLPAYYGLASAFVLASVYEPWGLVVNEAMAAGLPVIVSDRCGCAPDLVREGRNGLLFDPRDADALAAAMGRLAHGRADRAAMGEESRAIIAGWGPSRFAEGLRAAVGAALSAPPPSATPAERALLWALANR